MYAVMMLQPSLARRVTSPVPTIFTSNNRPVPTAHQGFTPSS